MPESKRRKPKPGRVRQRLARVDGLVVKVNACCRLEVVLGPIGLEARHDARCPALRPASPKFLAARTMANQAVGRIMEQHGFGPVLTVMRASK